MIKKIFLIITLNVTILTLRSYSQSYYWQTLQGSPSTTSRFNDVSFINPNTGWICSASNGNIHKTTNGGNTWFIAGNTPFSNRCLAFFDSLNGWTGEYDSFNRISRTTDGGLSWTIITLPPPLTTGICGMSVVSDSVIFGCGRYWGPARVIKTTNKGINWINIDMSGYARGLVDCYFTSADSGIVVGRAGPNGSIPYPIILHTIDGGLSWDTVFYSSEHLEWCWKISFPTNRTGYVSLEPNGSDETHFLKTTDSGLNWIKSNFISDFYDEEGIGFINDSTGWIGGRYESNYETTNGGKSWYPAQPVSSLDTLQNVNRFIFFGDTLGYAVGKRVYKYQKGSLTPVNSETESNLNDFTLFQNYPNPFNPKTTIKIELPQAANISLKIYNILGKEITTIIEGDFIPAGVYEFDWEGSDVPSGVYYYRLYNKDFEITKSMVFIK